MGTTKAAMNSEPSDVIPQPIEPNSHSPRNRNMPMTTSRPISTTSVSAARASPAMTRSSRPVTESSAFNRSMCAWISAMPAARTRPMDSPTPAAGSVSGPGRSLRGGGVPVSKLSADLTSLGERPSRLTGASWRGAQDTGSGTPRDRR